MNAEEIIVTLIIVSDKNLGLVGRAGGLCVGVEGIVGGRGWVT